MLNHLRECIKPAEKGARFREIPNFLSEITSSNCVNP